MLLWLLVLVVIGCSFAFYRKHWLTPLALQKWYHQTFQSLGYRVLQLPYRPFSISLTHIRNYNQQHYNDACYDQKQNWHNYDLVITNTGPMITLILLHPRFLKNLFSPQKEPLITKSLNNKAGFSLILKDSIVLNNNDYSKQKRKVFGYLLSYDFVISKFDRIVHICLNQLEQLEKSSKVELTEDHRIYSVELLPWLEKIISHVVVGLFFGTGDAPLEIQGIPISRYISQLLATARQQSNDWLVMLMGSKTYQWGLRHKYRELRNCTEKMRDVVRNILNNKTEILAGGKAPKRPGDLFQALYNLKEQLKTDQPALNIQEYISQFCAFMSASTDSTANFLNGILFYISSQPRIHNHLKSALPNTRSLTYQAIRQIDYLQWCCLQTIRMYGPGTSILLRQTLADTYIENVPIVKGTGLKIEMLASHYNPKLFSQPFKFEPNRWKNKDIDPFTFGTFGLGSHACIGKQLALLTTKAIITILLSRYDKIELESPPKTWLFTGSYHPQAYISQLYLPRKSEAQLKNKPKLQEQQ